MAGNSKSMILEMLGVIGGFGMLAAVFIAMLADRVCYSLLGLLCGLVLAGGMLLYMNHILIICAGLDGKAVEKCVIKHSIIRYIGVAVLFGLICITEIADPITCFIGLLGLKAAAYLQPLIHKLLCKKREEI